MLFLLIQTAACSTNMQHVVHNWNMSQLINEKEIWGQYNRLQLQAWNGAQLIIKITFLAGSGKKTRVVYNFHEQNFKQKKFIEKLENRLLASQQARIQHILLRFIFIIRAFVGQFPNMKIIEYSKTRTYYWKAAGRLLNLLA